MNKEWYLQWQKKLNHSSSQTQLWRFFGIHVVYFYIIGGALMLILPQFRLLAYTGLLAVAIGWGVLVKAARFFMPKKRPYQAYGITIEEGGLFSRIHQSPNSFPSGHAGSLAALSTVLIVAYPWWGVLSFVVLFLNGLARVILGYHYWLDIVVGILLGIAAGIGAIVAF